MNRTFCYLLAVAVSFGGYVHGQAHTSATPSTQSVSLISRTNTEPDDWSQWRGPNRDGILKNANWPDSLDGLKKQWSIPLEPSYSGPLVVGDLVFTTQTENKKHEVVVAVNRMTGKKVWEQKWLGSMSVPFFAKANGDWIRATPAFDDGRLYVAGMRDVLVCLDASDGKVIWKVDFPAEMKSQVHRLEWFVPH